jgi:hypothetical protein
MPMTSDDVASPFPSALRPVMPLLKEAGISINGPVSRSALKKRLAASKLPFGKQIAVLDAVSRAGMLREGKYPHE